MSHDGYTRELQTIKKLASANFVMKHNPEWIEELNIAAIKEKPELKSQLEDSCAILPLARKFPSLRVPYIQLCDLPTPVERLEHLSWQTGAKIFIKRDDLTGGYDLIGKEIYGGNKPRKLGFELAHALSNGADSIITFGCAGSNHAIATSVHASRLGLKPICMLKPQPNSHVVRKNLLLHLANGTQLHYAPNNDTRKIATFAVWNDFINKGEYPYIIPTGGSTPLGTLGFVDAALELSEQIDAGLIPKPDYMYVACGSCATTAGLLLGFKLAGLKCKVIAVAVEPEETPGEFKENIATLFNKTNQLLHSLTNGQAPIVDLESEDYEINLDFTGPDYAVFTAECVAARDLLKRAENITIEGTYTGKALAALLHDIVTKKIENKTILFWNTYCDADFANRIADADYKNLPTCFHAYFEEDVQELDR